MYKIDITNYISIQFMEQFIPSYEFKGWMKDLFWYLDIWIFK